MAGKRLKPIIDGKMQCAKCHRLLPTDRFYKRVDGRYRSWCKSCANQYSAENKGKQKARKIVRALPAEMIQQITTLRAPDEGDLQPVKEENAPPPKWPPAILDWLTPLFGTNPRPKELSTPLGWTERDRLPSSPRVDKSRSDEHSPGERPAREE